MQSMTEKRNGLANVISNVTAIEVNSKTDHNQTKNPLEKFNSYLSPQTIFTNSFFIFLFSSSILPITIQIPPTEAATKHL